MHQIEKLCDAIRTFQIVHTKYIDNFMLSLAVAQNSNIDAKSYFEIIDRNIYPEQRSDGARPFQKMAAGYFIYKISQYEGSSIRTLTKLMHKHFDISKSEIEKAYKRIKDSSHILNDQDMDIYLCGICFVVLLISEFDPYKYSGDFAHPSAKKNFHTVLENLDRFYTDISVQSIRLSKPFFVDLPDYFCAVMPDIVIEQIKKGLAGNSEEVSPDAAAIIVMFACMHNVLPDLSKNEDTFFKFIFQ